MTPTMGMPSEFNLNLTEKVKRPRKHISGAYGKAMSILIKCDW